VLSVADAENRLVNILSTTDEISRPKYIISDVQARESFLVQLRMC